MKRNIWILAIFVVCNAHAAMPDFDVKAYCAQIASISGSPSEMLRQGCYQQEQTSYNGLKPVWDRLSAHTRNYCQEIAKVGSPAGSYMMLAGCVQQEQQAQSSNYNFQFQK